jgi:hypothetical protein
MGENRRKTTKSGTGDLSPQVKDALAQLADAHDAARDMLEKAGYLSARSETAVALSARRANATPQWDPATRVLRVGRRIVKQFRVPSPNQEKVLVVFQEEGWPPRIDDPLTPVPDGCPKDRLRDTIRYLNKGQENRLIRFRGDGTGEGVVWELTKGKKRSTSARKS